MLTLILSSIGFAVPLQVTQQGRILDSNGAGVSGLHDLTFRIYDAETSGTLLWEETITETMTNGYYAAVLGADETNNPLDSTILELYPIYLEFQLDSNSPVATRQAINSAPYAQIAGKAEVATSVNGGSVNATDVQISGNPVIDGTGSWVGQPITVDWNNIDPSTIPSYLADGDDNTQLSKTEVLNYVDGETLNLGASSQVDGSDIVTADSFSTYLPADADTLAGLNCATGEIASWDGNSSWVCTSDNTLEWADIELLLNNNPVDLNASTTIGGAEIITTVDDADTLASLSCQLGEVAKYDDTLGDWYCDIDSVLSDSDVLGYVNGEALSLASGTKVNGSDAVTASSFLSYLPSELADGDADTQLSQSEVVSYVEAGSVNLATGSQVNSRNIVSQPSTCFNGQVLVYNSTSNDWACGDDTDTTLTPTEMQTLIEALSLNLQNVPQVNGEDVLTTGTSIGIDQLNGSGGTSGQVLTTDGTTTSWGAAPATSCTESVVEGSAFSYIVEECTDGTSNVRKNSKRSSRVKSFPTQNTHGNALCIINESDKLYCWGDDTSEIVTDAPTDEVKSLAISNDSCAIMSDDTVQCWGSNSNGIVTGVPSGAFSKLYIQGSSHACGIKTDGTVSCWGSDSKGVVSGVPTDTFQSLASINSNVCGIKTDGAISCWGTDVSASISSVPTGTFTTITSGTNRYCALKSTGDVICWGYNYASSSSDQYGTYTHLSSYGHNNCALKSSGQVKCWGDDTHSVVSDAPSGTFTDIEVGYLMACALSTNGTPKCWGKGSYVYGAPTSGEFDKIQGGLSYACGRHTSGEYFCWGNSNSKVVDGSILGLHTGGLYTTDTVTTTSSSQQYVFCKEEQDIPLHVKCHNGTTDFRFVSEVKKWGASCSNARVLCIKQ